MATAPYSFRVADLAHLREVAARGDLPALFGVSPERIEQAEIVRIDRMRAWRDEILISRDRRWALKLRKIHLTRSAAWWIQQHDRTIEDAVPPQPGDPQAG